jgi:hypothetical protein
MNTDLVIAGLSVPAFDEVRKTSAQRFAPNGQLFTRPVTWPGYDRGHANHYLDAMRDRILKLPEDEKVRCTIAYVDYNDTGTADFIDAFFPFALKRAIKPLLLDEAKGATAKRRTTSQYISYIVSEVQELRSRAALISEHTHIHNRNYPRPCGARRCLNL